MTVITVITGDRESEQQHGTMTLAELPNQPPLLTMTSATKCVMRYKLVPRYSSSFISDSAV